MAKNRYQRRTQIHPKSTVKTFDERMAYKGLMIVLNWHGKYFRNFLFSNRIFQIRLEVTLTLQQIRGGRVLTAILRRVLTAILRHILMQSKAYQFGRLFLFIHCFSACSSIQSQRLISLSTWSWFLRNPGPLTLQFFAFSEIKCLECEQYSHIAQLAKESDYEI